jgi:hypothetical protein
LSTVVLVLSYIYILDYQQNFVWRSAF